MGWVDVAFTVDDCRAIYEKAIRNGATSVRAPWEESDKEGVVVMATVATVIIMVHCLIGNSMEMWSIRLYRGLHIPGNSCQDTKQHL